MGKKEWLASLVVSRSHVKTRARQSKEEHQSYRDEDHGGMVLDPGLVALAHEAQGAHGTGDEQLDGQDGVDLADELVPDVDGGLGHALAVLEVVGQVVILAPARAAGEQARLVVVGTGGLVRGGCLAVLRGGGGPCCRHAVRVVLRRGGVLCVGHGRIVFWRR